MKRLDANSSPLPGSVNISGVVEEAAAEGVPGLAHDAQHLRGDGCCIARSGKLDRARSRLYRGQILQENMRLKALAEIYTMHSFAQLCNLNICQHFAKMFAKFCRLRQI